MKANKSNKGEGQHPFGFNTYLPWKTYRKNPLMTIFWIDDYKTILLRVGCLTVGMLSSVLENIREFAEEEGEEKACTKSGSRVPTRSEVALGTPEESLPEYSPLDPSSTNEKCSQ